MLADDELRSFLARLLGWTNVPAVERAIRSIEFGVTHRQLVLCGDGTLVPIAHALHRRMLGGLEIVEAPATTDVAGYVVSQVARGDTTVVVYVGASWCEPCEWFHELATVHQLAASSAADRHTR